MKTLIFTLILSLFASYSFAFEQCSEPLQQLIKNDLEIYQKSAQTIIPNLNVSIVFECEAGFAFDTYNGYFDGSTNKLHYLIPKKWTPELIQGPIAHEFGHAVWNAFTKNQFVSPRINQIASQYSQAEKKILPLIRSLERNLIIAHYTNPSSSDVPKLSRRLDQENARLDQALKMDGFSQLYYAMDELIADSLAVFFTQNLKANSTVISNSHRDFSVKYSAEGWTETLFENRRSDDLYEVLVPARFSIGTRITGLEASNNMKTLLTTLKNHLEEKSHTLTVKPKDMNWDTENLEIINRL